MYSSNEGSNLQEEWAEVRSAYKEEALLAGVSVAMSDLKHQLQDWRKYVKENGRDEIGFNYVVAQHIDWGDVSELTWLLEQLTRS